MAYQVMGLSKKEKEELKRLLRINTPVPSQKKRINFLKSRQKPTAKSKKPLDDKTSQSQKNLRKFKNKIRQDQLAKKPIKPRAVSDELGGSTEDKKKKPKGPSVQGPIEAVSDEKPSEGESFSTSQGKNVGNYGQTGG